MNLKAKWTKIYYNNEKREEITEFVTILQFIVSNGYTLAVCSRGSSLCTLDLRDLTLINEENDINE